MTDHKSLTHALVAFQAELPDVSKGSTNPAFHSKYADLADVSKAVFPVLAKHGLAFTTFPDDTEQGYVLRYELRHTSGESITGVWRLPDGAKAQEYGSWITYGRRYALSAVTGISPDVDDDGNAATSNASVRRTKVADPQEKIAAAVKAANEATDPAKLDGIEDHAKTLGIAGVPGVRAALEAARTRLGASGVDHWTVKDVPA
jgi:hypothetical protein